MRMFLLSALLASQLLLLAGETRGQELDKVIISLNVKDVSLKQVFKENRETNFFLFHLFVRRCQ